MSSEDEEATKWAKWLSELIENTDVVQTTLKDPRQMEAVRTSADYVRSQCPQLSDVDIAKVVVSVGDLVAVSKRADPEHTTGEAIIVTLMMVARELMQLETL